MRPLGLQMRDELKTAWGMAAAFSVIAALPLTAIGLIVMLEGARAEQPLSLVGWLATVATVFGSYFVAATLASPIYTLFRSIRSSLLGSMIAGAVVTPIVYGAVALVAATVWNPAGQFIFGRHGMTRTEFMGDFPILVVVFAAAGLFGGPLLRSQARGRAV